MQIHELSVHPCIPKVNLEKGHILFEPVKGDAWPMEYSQINLRRLRFSAGY